MIKNRLDFKLINLALLVLIIYMLYQTNEFWIYAVTILSKICFPFFMAFSISYALYPFSKFLQKHKIPKFLSHFIVISIVFFIFILTIFIVFPLLFEQLGSLFSGIITFIKEISLEYDIDFGTFQSMLSDTFNEIIRNVGKYISNGAITFIGVSFDYLTIIVIVIASAIYFLIDMDKIREKVKLSLYKNKKLLLYIKQIDTAMKNYLAGFIKIVFITLFEYSIAFLIIKHPNAILLGFLASVTSLIPYFGGMFTNLIAAITAFVISPSLFLKTIIVFVILSVIDSYVINPYVYGKTNKVHPLIVILAVFAGGKIGGIFGIIISLPFAIILITTYNYFKFDINRKIVNKKRKVNE